MPVLDKDPTYQCFLHTNVWASQYLANAFSIKTHPGDFSITTRSWLDYLLFLPNLLFFALQYLYMRHKITKETISLHAAYFHPGDLSASLEKHLKL